VGPKYSPCLFSFTSCNSTAVPSGERVSSHKGVQPEKSQALARRHLVAEFSVGNEQVQFPDCGASVLNRLAHGAKPKEAPEEAFAQSGYCPKRRPKRLLPRAASAQRGVNERLLPKEALTVTSRA
jgi:hypothetical protein